MNANEEHNEHEPSAFEADKVIFQVRDLADKPDELKPFSERLVDALGFFLNSEANSSLQEKSQKGQPDLNWRGMVKPPTRDDLRVIEFPTPLQGSQRFSLIPLTLEGRKKNGQEPDDVLKVLNDAYAELRDLFSKPGGGGEPGKSKSQHIPIGVNKDIGLISISPNWLGGGLPHTKPTGGPGSLPTPLAAGTQRRFEIRGLEVLDSLSRHRRPGAQIVIFDTARDLNELPDIFTKDPPMEVYRYPNYPNPQPEFDALIPYWVPHNEHYDKSDHGTFIADIIRKITPGAQIYLYEVLNRFGDGSFVTVSHGLTEALNRHAQGNTKLVFNCSFGMVRELPKYKSKSKNELWETTYRALYKDTFIQELIFKALDDAFDQVISHPNITVVAAAGNDANPVNEKREVERGKPRPPAWYPAAFDKVLSVAALPKHYPPRDATNGNKFEPASYSNKARSPGKDDDKAYSFATFGGERRNEDGNPFPTVDGVVGVYLGKIPKEKSDGSILQDGSDNQTHVAEWSGTSFATPIISALIAAQENELIDLVHGSHNDIGPFLTIDDENVIPVHQV